MSGVRRDTFLLLGGTTHRNRGDLAMHQGLIAWLAHEFPTLRILFLANNPDTTRSVLGVESALSPDADLAQPWNRDTPRSTPQRISTWWRGVGFCRRPGSFASHLERAAAVFIPGSGSMNSLWWHDWLYVKAAEIHAAHRAGVPVCLTSQGIGPDFTHRLDRWIAGSMFRRCAFIGVRDGSQSIRILTGAGVPESLCHHTGDDALLVQPESHAAERLLASIPAGRITVGINVRDSSTYGRKYPKPATALWASAADALIDAGLNIHFVFVPVSYDQQDDDRVAARAAVASMRSAGNFCTVLEDELDAAEIRGIVSRLDVGVGISYHFLLFCLAAGVPALAAWQNPYYRHKQEGLMSLFQCPESMINLAETTATDLTERLARLIQNRQDLRARLLPIATNLESTAEASRQCLVHVLKKACP